MDQIRVQVITTGGGGVETELLKEFLKHISDNGLFVLHGEHPNTEIFGFVSVAEFLAGQTQQGEGDLVPKLFMVGFCQSYCFVIEQAGISHLDCGFDPVFVGDGLLGFEDIQAFGQQGFTANVLLFALSGDLLSIFRNHFRPVDHI